MTYYAYMDPENAVDFPSFEKMQDRLDEHWTDDDTVEVQRIMADYLTGAQDGFAKAKLWRQIAERAEMVVARE